MDVLLLIEEFRQRDVVLLVDGDKLVCDAPKGELTDADRETIREHKPQLVDLLRAEPLDADLLEALREADVRWADAAPYRDWIWDRRPMRRLCGGGNGRRATTPPASILADPPVYCSTCGTVRILRPLAAITDGRCVDCWRARP